MKRWNYDELNYYDPWEAKSIHTIQTGKAKFLHSMRPWPWMIATMCFRAPGLSDRSKQDSGLSNQWILWVSPDEPYTPSVHRILGEFQKGRSLMHYSDEPVSDTERHEATELHPNRPKLALKLILWFVDDPPDQRHQSSTEAWCTRSTVADLGDSFPEFDLRFNEQ